MAIYSVSGYLVTIYSVSVEADDEDTAIELGQEMLAEGEGIQGDSEWQPEFDVYEEDN